MPVFAPPPSMLRRGAVTLATLAVAVVPSLTTSVDAAALRGSANSYAVNLSANAVVRWNPCAAIHYRVNLARAPAGALTDVKGAVARIAATTGMTFVYDGATTAVPTSTYGVNVPLTSTPPIVFAWAAPGTGAGRSNVLPATGSTVAVGAWAARAWTVGSTVHKVRIFTGYVVVNTSSNRSLPAGFGKGPNRGEMLMHELGHVVGLNHTGDRLQLMYPALGPYASWGAGDTTGLRRVGRSAGCIA